MSTLPPINTNGTAPPTLDIIDIDDTKKVKLRWKFLSEHVAQRTPVPGIHVLSDPNAGSFRKIAWSLLILGAISFTGWSIGIQIKMYLRHETETSISIEDDDSMDFPTITVCPVRSSDEDVLEFGGKKWIWSNFHTSSMLFEKYKKVHTLHGECLQYNTDGSWKAKYAGKYFNIFSSIYKDHFPRPPGEFNMSFPKQFEVWIKPSKIPTNAYFLEANSVPIYDNKNDIEIRIEATRRRHMNPELSKCNPSTEYVRESCMINCFRDYMDNQCGCRIKNIMENSTLPLCDTDKIPIIHKLGACDLPTFSKQAYEYYVTKLFSESNCRKSCPINCDVTQYSLQKYTGYINKDKPAFMLYIFFQNLVYQDVVTREAYSQYELFCDIGGALGLLLGTTMMSLLDLADLLFVRILRKTSDDRSEYKLHDRKCNGVTHES